jgi:hypothetical protein
MLRCQLKLNSTFQRRRAWRSVTGLVHSLPTRLVDRNPDLRGALGILAFGRLRLVAEGQLTSRAANVRRGAFFQCERENGKFRTPPKQLSNLGFKASDCHYQ